VEAFLSRHGSASNAFRPYLLAARPARLLIRSLARDHTAADPGAPEQWHLRRADQPDHEGRLRGYVDKGWKDTLLLMPGERVRLLLRFEPYSGLYLYHCHNLEHEDAGMMANYLIRS
jgi:FtsP/CotA-like multicopper oxidase with cupredoxin domain